MSHPIVDSLKTLRKKLIKDHEAAIELIDKQIDSLELIDSKAKSAGSHRSTTDMFSFNKDKPYREIDPDDDGAGLDQFRFNNNTHQGTENLPKTQYSLPSNADQLTGRIVPSKFDYNLIGSRTVMGTVLQFREVSKTNTSHFNDFTVICSSPADTAMVARLIESKVGLNTAQFLKTLANQVNAGKKQAIFIPIPGSNVFAINVTLTQNNTVGRPVSYYFHTNTARELGPLGYAALGIQSLYGF